jgi:hypothetical protein
MLNTQCTTSKLRRFTDGTFTRESLQQLLVLLSVIQTCEYRRINPLRFLLAGDTQLRGMSDFPKKCGHRRVYDELL